MTIDDRENETRVPGTETRSTEVAVLAGGTHRHPDTAADRDG